MHATTPALLDAATLTRRLAELAGDERAVQVEFLLHLEEFDRREAWLEAGYGSLWDYCLRVLHLREGAAARRIRAMRALRRLPDLAEPLRDGRICLSTLGILDPILTAENLGELVARAAYRSKVEVETLLVSLRPRQAPRDGVRRVADRRESTSGSPLALAPTGQRSEPVAATTTPQSAPPPALVLTTPTRPSVRPVAADTWSLRVTVDAAFKEELDRLTELLSHKLPGGELSAVLREAVHCALKKHGKRKGSVAPARPRSKGAVPAATPPARAPITAEVRRQVWQRDEGRCAWTGPDGHRCGSRWRVEVDHVDAAALGGPSSLANLRLACAAHNRLHAEKTFGRAFMDRFRRRRPVPDAFTAAGGSGFYAPAPE